MTSNYHYPPIGPMRGHYSSCAVQAANAIAVRQLITQLLHSSSLPRKDSPDRFQDWEEIALAIWNELTEPLPRSGTEIAKISGDVLQNRQQEYSQEERALAIALTAGLIKILKEGCARDQGIWS